MCGLVGFFGATPGNNWWELSRNLLYVNAFRGEHSTGVYVENFGGNRRLMKGTGNISVTEDMEVWRLFNKPEDPNFFNSPKDITPAVMAPNVFIGHSRWATTGAVNVKNAHPFENEHTVVAHNGTLSQYSFNRLNKDKEFEVDSAALAAAIDADPTNIPALYKDVTGAMAVTVWDKTNKVLRIFRNDQRPLFLIPNKTKTCVMWSSEKGIARFAVSRTRGQDGIWDFDAATEVPVDTLISLRFPNYKDGLQREEVTMKPNVFFTGYYSEGVYRTIGTGGAKGTQQESTKTTSSKARTKGTDLTTKSGLKAYYAGEEGLEEIVNFSAPFYTWSSEKNMWVSSCGTKPEIESFHELKGYECVFYSIAPYIRVYPRKSNRKNDPLHSKIYSMFVPVYETPETLEPKMVEFTISELIDFLKVNKCAISGKDLWEVYGFKDEGKFREFISTGPWEDLDALQRSFYNDIHLHVSLDGVTSWAYEQGVKEDDAGLFDPLKYPMLKEIGWSYVQCDHIIDNLEADEDERSALAYLM